MTTWQPGMRVTAARLQAGLDVETTTAGAVIATGFSLVLFSARRVGGICSIRVDAQRTGADIAPLDASGNIGDTTLVTIPAGWRPTDIYEGMISDGTGAGDFNINSSGTVVIRTWTPAPGVITATAPTRTLRLAATYVL